MSCLHIRLFGTLSVSRDDTALDGLAACKVQELLCYLLLHLVRGVPSDQLDATQAGVLRNAVDLYQGHLLEGWYHDWCLSERERLQDLHLAVLDKLMDYCGVQRDYESAMAYGARILRHDRARECTHQRLMRLQYLAGDRAGALRQ